MNELHDLDESKIRRLLISTPRGPAVAIYDIDPPLEAGEVEIDANPPLPSWSTRPTRPMDPVQLNDLLSWCR